MIDAQGIADAVNRQTGDLVSARMVREYVRLGIIPKALHPGRNGFDLGAIDDMIRARSAVRSGASLTSLVAEGRPRQGAVRGASARVVRKPARTWFWIGPTDLKMAIEFPAALDPGAVQSLTEDIRAAIDRWGRKYSAHRVRGTVPHPAGDHQE